MRNCNVIGNIYGQIARSWLPFQAPYPSAFVGESSRCFSGHHAIYPAAARAIAKSPICRTYSRSLVDACAATTLLALAADAALGKDTTVRAVVAGPAAWHTRTLTGGTGAAAAVPRRRAALVGAAAARVFAAEVACHAVGNERTSASVRHKAASALANEVAATVGRSGAGRPRRGTATDGVLASEAQACAAGNVGAAGVAVIGAALLVPTVGAATAIAVADAGLAAALAGRAPAGNTA